MSRTKKHTKFPGYKITVRRATVDVIVKSCPFCGPAEKGKGTPFVKKDGSSMSDDDGPCWVECGSCGAQGPESDNQGEAADRWNRRTNE